MKILFLDLDGTVREPKRNGDTFINIPENQRLIDGVADAIKHYAKEWLIIGTTNQGGVAAGHKSIQSAISEQKITLHLIPQMRAIYFCPDFEGKECWRVYRHEGSSTFHWETLTARIISNESYRKPGAGMIRVASQLELGSLKGAWMIGDRPEDEQCAAAAQINFMWADVWRDRFKKGMGTTDLTQRGISRENLLQFLKT